MMDFLLPPFVKKLLPLQLSALTSGDIGELGKLAVSYLDIGEEPAVRAIQNLIGSCGHMTVKEAWESGAIQKELAQPAQKAMAAYVEKKQSEADVFACCTHCDHDFMAPPSEVFVKSGSGERGMICPHCTQFTLID